MDYSANNAGWGIRTKRTRQVGRNERSYRQLSDGQVELKFNAPNYDMAALSATNLIRNASRLHVQLEQQAPAKINLGLHVLRKRPDGYHDIETVFLRVPWVDHITVRPADQLRMTCSDPALPTDERNLCLKAALALREAGGVKAGAALHLEKRVPYGAGLGGGSSDAAATLQLLAHLWKQDMPETDLARVAAQIGSDVPFFLGPPAAYATGRGECLRDLRDPTTQAPYRCPFALVILVPPVQVATAEAYRVVQPRDDRQVDLQALVQSNDLERWRAELRNDFEHPVAAAFPPIAEALAWLREAEAAYVALSGSGAAVFGVFKDPRVAQTVAETARNEGRRVWWGLPEAETI